MENNELEEYLKNLNQSLNEIKIKLSMPNSITQIRNARFWLPNYPRDIIQKIMVDTSNYWDTYALNFINIFLKENATILDIGANIGSHSIYWAIERNAAKVYSFEPLPSTFEILKKNIELNKLEDKIIPYNFGLSDKKSKAMLQAYDHTNIGSASFIKDKNGIFELKTLDSLKIKDKIDLIKIDVEGAEVEVLQGAKKTILKNKPTIVIESFHNKDKVDEILNSLGYLQTLTIREGEDFIYQFVQ